MSTELIQKPTYTNEQRELIRNTVAAGATDVELDYFLAYTTSKGFDPFSKEVWFIKTKGYTKKNGTKVEPKVQIMTGIDGFFRKANENPNYDGCEHNYGELIEVPINAKEAPDVRFILAPEWVETVVYRKDRKLPERRIAYWREFAQELVSYYGNLTLWAQKPTVMLEKCADALALRKAFPQELGDLKVPEEMPREYSADEQERKDVQQLESEQRANYLTRQTARLEQSGEYLIEFGNSHRGSKVSEATNSIWLERHLAKYKSQIPDAAQKIIEGRIAELKRAYAEKLAAEQAETVSEEGWTPTEEEAAEIAAQEALENK